MKTMETKTMSQLTKEEYKRARKVVTGKVRCSYVNVFKPRENPNSGELEYSMELMIPKSDKDTVAKCRKAIAAMVAHKFPNGRPQSKIWFECMLDADKEVVTGADGVTEVPLTQKRPETKGCYLIRVKSKADQQPIVVDAQKQPVMRESDFQSGDYARVSINFHPFSVGKNAGVTAFINAIQVVEKGEPLGGGVDIDEEFDDWEAEEETAATADDDWAA